MNTHKKERAPIYPPREYKVRRRYRQTNKILAGFYIDCQDNKSAEFITPEGRVYSPKALQQLIKQARADQLKKLWNATQHDIVPEGTPPRDMSEELHKMIKELEE